ncbi:MAG: hypothetical protein V3U75_04070 [Methylococcaceae bacterium]
MPDIFDTIKADIFDEVETGIINIPRLDIFDEVEISAPIDIDNLPRFDAPEITDPEDISVLPTEPILQPKEQPLQLVAHKGRFPLSPDATRMEKFDRMFDVAIGTPLRVFLKFAKGKTFNLPDLMWAGLKKITPDSMWTEEVKKMTLDEAMDWAAGHDPQGFEKLVGDTAEFIGRLQTAQKVGQATGILGTKGTLPKDIGVLNKALESAKLFGLGESGKQLQRLLSETIDPATDYQYEGATAVLKDMGIGAGISLGHSLIVKPLLARIAQTGAGKAIIESYDRAMIEITKRFPVFADAIRKNPTDTISKEVDRQFVAKGIDPGQFTPEQRAVANHIAREMERRFVRASKNFRPAEDIVRAKVKPKLLPGKVKPPVEAPIVAAEPTTPVEKPVIPPKVTEKPEITAPTEAAEAEKARKPLPEKEVTEKKPQEAKIQALAKELEKSLKLSPERALRVAEKKLALEEKKPTKEDKAAPSLITEGEVTAKPIDKMEPSQFEFHGGPEEIIGGKLQLRGRGGQDAGGIFTTKNQKLAEEFIQPGGKLYRVNIAGKKRLDLTSQQGIEKVKNWIGEKYIDEGKELEFSQQDFDFLFPTIEGKQIGADWATFGNYTPLFEEKGFDGVQLWENTLKKIKSSAWFKGGLQAEEVQPPAPAKPVAKVKPPPTEEVITVEKPIDVKTEIPKAPKVPVTEQEPTIPLKGKESQVFREEVKTQEKITAAEEGEVGIEPAGASFTDHIDTFHTYQLPETSKIPKITKEIKKINGLRLAGKITPQQANQRIHNLRQSLLQAAIKEKIALRVNKKGKVKIALRESGVFVPEEVATYKKYKNIQPMLAGGQDITRAIQQMDGSLTVKEKLQTKGQAGPIERFVLWRTRKMTLQKLNWLKEKTIEIRSILEAKKGSKKDKEINLVLEKIGKADRDTPIKDVLSKKTLASFSKESVKAAQELRQFYDDLIEEQNAARLMRGQDEIPYRQNYSPNILRDTTVWEQLFLRDKTAKVLEGKDLPDYIKPNAPFNPRAEAREADIPYDKRILSARELAESYAITAAKDIFNTSIIQNNKAFIEQLKGQGLDKSAEYLGEWTATSFAGIKPRLDRAIKIPRWAEFGLRYFNRLRNMAVFPFNVAWSLSTQPLSLSNTIGRYGLPNTVKGFFQWLKPSIRKQAAQDYFSFIVKTTKRGGVTRQDAANLLGENVKTQKTVGEFVENFSTILLTEMEKLLTGMSIRAAHIQGTKRGLKGEALKNFASDGGAKTQSMYNDEDKPMILRSLLVKSAAPYQTYAFEVANTFREWAGKTGTPPDTKLYAMWSVTRWLAAMIILRMLANRVKGKEWSWWDLIPIPFREFWLSPIARKLTGEFIPGSAGLTSPVETATKVAKGLDDVLETGNWRKLRNETLRYAPGVVKIPGGVQISRMTDAIIVYSSGGLTDRRGRVLFEMKDPEDLGRAMFTGVWTTKEAQVLLRKRKGKKTEKEGIKFQFGK